MLNPLPSITIGLLIASVPLGWYQGIDGYFSAVQAGSLDKNLRMLSVSEGKPSDQFPTDGVVVQAKIYNNTEGTIYVFEAGSQVEDFSFKVNDSKGADASPSKLSEQLKNEPISMNIPPYPLKPGESIQHIIELSKDFNLTPGVTYSVELFKSIGLDSAYRTSKKVSSNVIQITVPK